MRQDPENLYSILRQYSQLRTLEVQQDLFQETLVQPQHFKQQEQFMEIISTVQQPSLKSSPPPTAAQEMDLQNSAVQRLPRKLSHFLTLLLLYYIPVVHLV